MSGPTAAAAPTPHGQQRARSHRSLVLATIPVALAIAAFGTVYGAAASAEFGPELTVAMSLLVFSGATQFATLGLVASGAGSLAILVTVAALNARHVVLGAAIRPHIRLDRRRRIVLSWFLLDESFGLAMASKRHAGVVLLVTGATCYVAWQVGTLLGVVGARLVALEDLAVAIFPVLFIGLAALTATGRHRVLRIAAAAVGVAVGTLVIPTAAPFLPIALAVLVAIPEGRGR
jgi:predicted branched-subunit amino acid permease